MSSQQTVATPAYDRVSLTMAARVAWAVLAMCFVVWISSFALLDDARWVVLVRHGLEGAFVGGLCDAFAIWRMYAAIERGYEPLSHEVSRFVVHEIMRAEDMMKDIRASLDAPETTQELLRAFNERFSSRRQLEAVCLDFWEKELQAPVLDRMVAADLHALLDDSGATSALLDNGAVRVMLRHCLSVALDDTGRTTRLHKLIELPWLGRKLFKEEDLHKKLNEVVKTLGEPPKPGPTEVGTLLREYLAAYVGAWSELPEEERRAATAVVLETFGPIVIKKLAELLWDEREDLVVYLSSGEGLSRHPFVEMILRQLEPVIRRSPELIEGALREKLQSMGGRGVRLVIEANTRSRLDMIQLNGTLLGAAVGLAVGGLATVAPMVLR